MPPVPTRIRPSPRHPVALLHFRKGRAWSLLGYPCCHAAPPYKRNRRQAAPPCHHMPKLAPHAPPAAAMDAEKQNTGTFTPYSRVTTVCVRFIYGKRVRRCVEPKSAENIDSAAKNSHTAKNLPNCKNTDALHKNSRAAEISAARPSFHNNVAPWHRQSHPSARPLCALPVCRHCAVPDVPPLSGWVAAAAVF